MQSVSASTSSIHARRLFKDRNILQSLAPIGPLMETPDESTQFPYVANPGFDSNLAIILAAFLFSILCTLGISAAQRCTERWRVVSEPSVDVDVERATTVIKKMDIKAFPATIYDTGSPLGALDCPICLAQFMEGERVRILPECCHSFHADCIDTWLVSNPTCPSCRRSLLDVGLRKPSGVAWPAAEPTEGAGMHVTERNQLDATNRVVQTFQGVADDTTTVASSSLESIDLETGNLGESKSMIGKI